MSEFLRRSFVFCVALLVVLRPSRTFFISLTNCLVPFFSFAIPSLRKSSSSFLDLLRFFSSSKRSFTSLFKALSSFEISVLFFSELLKRSLVLLIALLQTFKPVLILFRSSWNNESVVGAVSLRFRCSNSEYKISIFLRSSLMTSTVTDVFPCSLSPATTTSWSLEDLWYSITVPICFKFEIILQDLINKNHNQIETGFWDLHFWARDSYEVKLPLETLLKSITEKQTYN